MSNFVNYDQMVLDFAAALTSANVGFKKVMVDPMDRDYEVHNMPLAGVALASNDPLNTAGQTYYCDVTIQVQIAAFDLTNRREAAKIRNDLVNATQRYFQENPRFGAVVDSTQVGRAEFETGESKEQGWQVAGAVLEFHVKCYSDR